MIYEKNNQYYLKIGDLYYLAEIVVKPHTIQILETNEYITELENAKELTFKEVKDRYIKNESENLYNSNFKMSDLNE